MGGRASGRVFVVGGGSDSRNASGERGEQNRRHVVVGEPGPVSGRANGRAFVMGGGR